MKFIKSLFNVLLSKNYRQNYSHELVENYAKAEMQNEKIYGQSKR